ncbi:MAG: hypothetical protein ABJC36_09235 [Gemmatimonadales bacterium]
MRDFFLGTGSTADLAAEACDAVESRSPATLSGWGRWTTKVRVEP